MPVAGPIIRPYLRLPVTSTSGFALFILSIVAICFTRNILGEISWRGLSWSPVRWMPFAIFRLASVAHRTTAQTHASNSYLALQSQAVGEGTPTVWPIVQQHITNSPGVPSGHAFTSSRVPRIDQTGFWPSTTTIPSRAAFLFSCLSRHRHFPLLALTRGWWLCCGHVLHGMCAQRFLFHASRR